MSRLLSCRNAEVNLSRYFIEIEVLFFFFLMGYTRLVSELNYFVFQSMKRVSFGIDVMVLEFMFSLAFEF